MSNDGRRVEGRAEAAGPRTDARRMRLAELTSSLGAGVLGAGIGVLFAEHLRDMAVPVLLVGALLHAWGMTDKHRLEAREGAVSVWWSAALYWVCWALLAALAVYFVVRVAAGP